MQNSTLKADKLIARNYNPRILKKMTSFEQGFDNYTKEIKIGNTGFYFVISLVKSNFEGWEYAFYLADIKNRKVINYFRDSSQSVNGVLSSASAVLKSWLSQQALDKSKGLLQYNFLFDMIRR